MHHLAGALLGLVIPLASRAALAEPGLQQLERSWQQLDRQLKALDSLLPSEPGSLPANLYSTPALPDNLIRANRPAASQLQTQGVQALSLEQALALAFQGSATLQAQREQVAASLATLQAALGSWWPRISAVASGGSSQTGSSIHAPVGNGALGFGPQFAPHSLTTPGSGTSDGAFYVPNGGGVYLNQSDNGIEGGLELNYDLIDFARTPRIQAARAQLRQARNTYANQLRQLQLQVSQAYYQLQQTEQTVRIRDAAVRNDLLILQDALDLKQAGLVPRLDVLRRRAIEASDQELLIQALADRAVARRRLAVVLNLPPQLTPEAGDPIRLQPRWPLDLDKSILAAYAGNPELDALLAARDALARERDATAAGLLPRLSLFAAAGGNATNTNQFNVTTSNGGCCGSTVVPVENSNGYSWSVGLTLRWLLFDAGTTAAQARALDKRAAVAAQQYAAQRNDIRLRLEQAFFNHEASLAKLASARRGVAATLEAFRDVRLRYQSGLSSELDLSNTQEKLIASLVSRLNATVDVNITYAQLLRELLPAPQDPNAPVPAVIRLDPTTPVGQRGLDDHQHSTR